jgi:monovalent cation:H+ antiporter-2, CPA2 family
LDLSSILRDLTIVLAIATGVALFFGKLRLPGVAAFLVAGVILGPTAAGLVSETAMVDSLAEIGIVLLLFTVGLEISLGGLGKMRRQMLLAGVGQVLLTILATAPVAALFGVPVPEAIFIGFVVSMSSTAIMLKVYADRMEIDTTQGRLSVGISLLQDLLAIPMILLIPSLVQWEAAGISAIVTTLGKAILAVALILILAQVVVPRLLKEVIRMNRREVLVLTVLLVCLGTAFLAYRLGLSLGMGAFLAGLVISESEYVHEITAQVNPFREVFVGVFFISVGMLLDLSFLVRHLHLVLPIALAIVLVKAVFAGTAIRHQGFSWRVTVLAAFGLAQIGEFSFLLLFEGHRGGLVTAAQYQYLLAAAVLTMMAFPFQVHAAPGIAKRWERWVVRGREFQEAEEEAAVRKTGIGNHVIIAGYGVNGKNLARALRATHVPYVIADINDAVVQEARAGGEPIFYGDVCRPEILDRLGISRARMLVLAISDSMAARRTVAVARRSNPNLFILVRTRYVTDVDDLIALGANEVIPEEFETSVEIFARVLAEYHVPDHIIRQQEEIVRSGAYRMLRERGGDRPEVVLDKFEEFLRRKVIEIFYVSPSSGWVGKRVRDLPVGGDTGIILLSILRDDRAIVSPPPSETLRAEDKLVLFGGHGPLADALSALSRR